MSNISNSLNYPITKTWFYVYTIKNGNLQVITEQEYVKYIVGIINQFIKDNDKDSFDNMGNYLKKENIYRYKIMYEYSNNKLNHSSGERNINNFIKKKFGSLKKLCKMVDENTI